MAHRYLNMEIKDFSSLLYIMYNKGQLLNIFC